MLVEPLSHITEYKAVITANSLIRSSGFKLAIEILNPTKNEVMLYKFCNLGLIGRIHEPDVLFPRKNVKQERSQIDEKIVSDLPDKLKKFFKISVNDNEGEQIQKKTSCDKSWYLCMDISGIT